MAETLESIFADIRSRVLRKPPAVRAGAAATYRFEITGEGGGVMTLVVEAGGAEVETGGVRPAAVQFRLSMQDLRDLAGGRIRPFGLVLSGRLKITGNLSLAMRLGDILKPE
ncbi:putative Sterol-binding protein [Candidatus Hydrogenisulfobacillus filiaventi]|uniref:Putative Sterol-binding protein n=1 Tax=Candidatus Hydrogenisulfobacillus filiaventi TaxID=2707344 RepID=A0A6F8ZGG9_9FIRM|nr:putative Sterol-binding protein [Candidatus Hydrogenisulfobacillus filiaventi]